MNYLGANMKLIVECSQKLVQLGENLWGKEQKLDKQMQEHQKLCDEIMAIQEIEPIEAKMEEEKYKEFVSLVKRMREAQSDYGIIDMAYEYAKDHRCVDRELVLQRVEAMTKAIKLEDEVDEYLNNKEL